jgi:MFS transporter, OFA family, oxalate/formate antiporter
MLATPLPTPPNRWFIAAAAVASHLCIGSVYAYSVMTAPMLAVLDPDSSRQLTGDHIKVAFSIAIAVLGLSAAFLGKAAGRLGPQRAMLLAALCWAGGLASCALAAHFGSLALLYLGYGVLGGIGLGIGYITPVAVLVKWFPERKGLATGLAIMGFGFAAMIAGPAMAALFNTATAAAPVYTRTSVARTFLIAAVVYFLVMLVSSRLLVAPPADPAATTGPTGRGEWRDTRFVLLWWMFLLNIGCGITLISVASPLVQSRLSMTALQASAVVGLLGVFNGLGRFGWSSASDYLGRSGTFAAFFAVQLLCLLAMPWVGNPVLFQVLLMLVITCYGGGFATMPAFLSDLFGPARLGALLGIMLTAWSVAGVVGPSVLVPLVRRYAGPGYDVALLQVCAVLVGAGLVLSLALMFQLRRRGGGGV